LVADASVSTDSSNAIRVILAQLEVQILGRSLAIV
jgi:hypothetical protein